MNKLFWIFSSIIVLVTVGFLFTIGLNPKEYRIVKYSSLDSVEESAATVLNRLIEKVRKAPVLVLGVQAHYGSHYQLVGGILAELKNAGINYSNKYLHKGLQKIPGEVDSEWSGFDVRVDKDDLKNWITNKDLNSRSVIVLPTDYSSHVVGKTPLTALETESGVKVLTLSIGRYVLAIEDMKELSPGCDGTGIFSGDGEASLGCALLKRSQSVFRKNIDRKKYSVALDQFGELDYLVYFHAP